MEGKAAPSFVRLCQRVLMPTGSGYRQLRFSFLLSPPSIKGVRSAAGEEVVLQRGRPRFRFHCARYRRRRGLLLDGGGLVVDETNVKIGV